MPFNLVGEVNYYTNNTMIVFKPKEYSKPSTQAIYKFVTKPLKKAVGSVKKGMELGGEAVANINKSPIQRRHHIDTINKKYSKKALDLKAKRSAIDLQRKVKDVKDTAEIAAINPGVVANKAVETTVRNPIMVTGYATSGTLMATNPMFAGAPIGSTATAAEVALKASSPKYAKLTKKLADKYRDGKLSKAVEAGIDTLYHSTVGLTAI